jgi:hypothetical protein
MRWAAYPGDLGRPRRYRGPSVAKADHEARVTAASRAVLDGLVAGVDVSELHRKLAALAMGGDLVLAETLIRLAAQAIGLGGFSASEPVSYEGFRERFLPELDFRGRVDHRNSQYAIYAAAILHGGVVPDVASDTSWWRSELWPYALYGLVAYVRAAAEHRNVEVGVIARELAALAPAMD